MSHIDLLLQFVTLSNLQVPRLKQTFDLSEPDNVAITVYPPRELRPATNRIPLAVRNFPLDRSPFSAVSSLRH
jgi:hypothetical protein